MEKSEQQQTFDQQEHQRRRHHHHDIAPRIPALLLIAAAGAFVVAVFRQTSTEVHRLGGALRSTLHSTLRSTRLRVLGLTLLALLTLLLGPTGPFSSATLTLYAQAQQAIRAAHAGPHITYSPNTFARFRATGNAFGAQPANATTRTPTTPGPRTPTGKGPSQIATTLGNILTHPITLALDSRFLATSATHPRGVTNARGAAPTPVTLTSAEGLLRLSVTPGSVDLSHASVLVNGTATTPRGPFTLTFAQTQTGLRATFIQLAQFRLTVTDGQGRALQGVAFTTPLVVTLRYLPHELDDVNTASLRLSWPLTGDAKTLTAAQSVPLILDPRQHTMTASVDALAQGPLVLSASIVDANIASSQHVTMDGNQGDLSFSYPLTLPPAAGGLTPPVNLVYSSADPNERHLRTGASSWVGDGWNLSLGSISYDLSSNMYYFNGVGGVSEPLLCCTLDANGNHYFVPHHHPEIRVQASDNGTDPAHSTTNACFNVYTPDGMRYQYGCGGDGSSRRWTLINQTQKIYNEWDVNGAWREGASGSKNYLQSYQVHYWLDYSTSYNTQY
ncbi:MAG: hypothetical protein ABI068_06975, partial [Ktedonobacterales bacterium]